MKRHLWIATIVLLPAFLVGCQSHEPVVAEMGSLGSNGGLLLDWPANLQMQDDEIRSLHVRGDTLLVYTMANRGYWLTASGGKLVNANQLGKRGLTVQPPVVLQDGIIIPTTGTIQKYNKTGTLLATFNTPTALQSPAVGVGNSLYVGVGHSSGGRLARFDIGTTMTRVWELYTRSGIVAAPVVVNNAIYAGGYDGLVWAISSDRAPMWTIPDNVFKTGGQITADLSGDETGIYVASQDQKLYCLDRMTGRIRWVYYSSSPLVDKPILLGDYVYQYVPGRGMAALRKNEGGSSREPVWVEASGRQILSADEKNVYVRSGRGTILALDKATGERRFQSNRPDMTTFATNTETSTIYAGTRDGQVLAIRPTIKPGAVGFIVSAETPDNQPVAMND